MTPCREFFTDLTPLEGAAVEIANNMTIPAVAIGCIRFNWEYQGRKGEGILKNVLYVPELAKNLFSVHAAVVNGVDVNFTLGQCVLTAKSTGQIVAMGPHIGKQFQLHLAVETRVVEKAFSAIDTRLLHE